MTRLNILYEDNHIIVVYKYPGMLSQSDNTKDLDMLSLIKIYLKERYHKSGQAYVGLVHRLDRPVGGVMVYAKTSKAASRLSDQIRNKQMIKKYYALVHGFMEEENGVLKNRIEKINNKKVLLDTPNGKEALLKYNTIKKINNFSLVDITLLTGRYHQIRLQFSSRNHPLYGDYLYGTKNEKELALIAYSLSFKHPTTQEQLSFEIDIKNTNFNKILINC